MNSAFEVVEGEGASDTTLVVSDEKSRGSDGITGYIVVGEGAKVEIKQLAIRDPGAEAPAPKAHVDIGEGDGDDNVATDEHVDEDDEYLRTAKGSGRPTCFLHARAQLKFSNVYFESGGVIVATDPNNSKGCKVFFDNCTFEKECTLLMGDKSSELHVRTMGMTACVGWQKVTVRGNPKMKGL